jgi:hypothetical protein
MGQKYGHLANAAGHEQKACVICDTNPARYGWTDYSGEGYCLRCGTPYQLKWGTLKDGESYPRLNVSPTAVPMLRRYFAETNQSNGAGTFLIARDYPDQLEGRRCFGEWFERHQDDYPEMKP